MRYFLIDGTEKKGPYTVDELRSLAQQGGLVTEDLLLTEDESGQIRAGLVVGIFGPPQAAVIKEAEQIAPRSVDDVKGRRRFLTIVVSLLVMAVVLPFLAVGLTFVYLTQKTSVDRRQSIANLQELVKASFSYAAAHGDHLPVFSGMTNDLTGKLSPYGPVNGDGNKKQGEPWWRDNPVYSGALLGKIENPTQALLFFDVSPWRDGKYVVATADGTVKVVLQDEFEKLEKLNQKRQRDKASAAFTQQQEKKRAADKTGDPNAELSPQSLPTPTPVNPTGTTPFQK